MSEKPLITNRHPLLQLSRDFAEFCRPLTVFNIQHITYQKQYDDGARVSLSNQPNWIEDYYNLKLYESSLFENTPSKNNPTYDVWLGTYDLDVYLHGLKKYNSAYSISITEPTIDGCETYIFATSKEHIQSIRYISNHRDILYHFIIRFKSECQDLLTKANKNKIELPSLQLDDESENFQNKYNLDLKFIEQMHKNKNEYFKSNPIRKYHFQLENAFNLKISRQEIQCIIHLLHNKTANEIASHMSLSTRTAEHYINNIKLKFKCQTKAELLNIIKRDKKFTSAVTGSYNFIK